MTRTILMIVCVVVVGMYAYVARSNVLPSGSSTPADNYYNLLVQGFRAGHLSLEKDVPPGFAHLTDPYDPKANRLYRFAPYGLLDMSYYTGRLYLYFGVTPALLLFWPCNVLTGRYLSYGQAGVIFGAVGFVTSACVLYALWRRYFTEVSVWVVAAGVLALGLSTGVPVMLARCKVNDVAILCGYALTMVALAAIWGALRQREYRCRWLAVASVAYGLAVGARPSLLPGAAILLVPVAQAWRERERAWTSLMATIGPMALIGTGLMMYNYLRFGNPFEFGWHYELSPGRQTTQQLFSLQYLWFNFRVYFLEPARWSSRFPFVRDVAVPPMPRDYGLVEHPFGVLTTLPLVWLALAAPLSWRSRSSQERWDLGGFVMAVALLFGISASMVNLFWSAIIRYEVEFLPSFVLLATIGILSLDRALSGHPLWRRAARCGWGCLLAFSLAFNGFASVEACGEAHNDLGVALSSMGQPQTAIREYEEALYLNPDHAAAHYNLGVALARMGQMTEATKQWEQALRIKPDLADAHNNLGVVFMEQGKTEQAIAHYEQALQIEPDNAEAHNNLGNALAQEGRVREAIGHYQEALRIKPDLTQAKNALARLQAHP